MLGELVTIQLDKERHLKMTLGGMKRFKDETGIDLLRDGLNIKTLTEEQIIAFIWACLLHEDRKLTAEDVGFMLDATKVQEISEKIVEIWGASVPESTGSPDPNL
jgi:hypothetical protein